MKKRTIKQLPKYQRPREKLERYGVERLKDEELLALILGSGSKEKNAKQLAKVILKKLKNYPLNSSLNLSFFKDIKGVGKVKAGKIIASLELASRLIEKKNTKNKYLSPKDVFNRLFELRKSKKEHFVVFYLDVKNKEIAQEVISIGTLTESLVHPREVFEPAIKYLASKIIVAHNHPSGITKPSYEDISITKRLKKAGEILGIQLIDHVIVGSKEYFSFKQEGLL